MESVIEFKLPALGENIDQGDLVRLMIAPGAAVSEGQAVMELETDKAVVEVPSSISGTVNEILVKEGDKIKVGQVVFTADNGASAGVKGSPRQEEPAQGAEKSQTAQGSSGTPSSTTAVAAKAQAARASQAESQPAPQRTRSSDASAAREFQIGRTSC